MNRPFSTLLPVAVFLAFAGIAGIACAEHPAPAATPEVIAPGDLPLVAAPQTDIIAVKAAAKDAPAPMPDSDVQANNASASGDDNPRLAPAIYANKTQFRGDGFAYGSSPQEVQDRNVKPAAGLALNVPLN